MKGIHMRQASAAVSEWRWPVWTVARNGRILCPGRRAHGRADEAKRWRDKALRGRRRRLSRNVVSWALILTAIAILSGLIALKAYK